MEDVSLFSSRHAIEIETLLIYHRFCVKILLFPLFEKSSFIDNTCFKKCRKALWYEFFLGPILFIFEVMLPLFKWLITASLGIFASYIHLKCCFFNILRKTTSLCLSLYNWSLESVFICHMTIWYRKRKKINAKTQTLLSLELDYTTSNSKEVFSCSNFRSRKIKILVYKS